MHPLFSLDGQTALVTGAGSAEGIGFAAAKLLAEMGAEVAITATGPRIHQRVAELQEAGHTARGYIADLTDRLATRSMIEAVEADFGKIDILVNNAGMAMEGHVEEASEFAGMSDEAWDVSIARNLTTCYNVTRLVLPGMIRRKYGRIINVSSVTGPMVSSKGSSAYSAAKAAMVGMSRSIAIEVGMDNITINNVAPGWIATASQLEEEGIAAQYTPLKRAGTPMETASLIAYLATPGASYITGQIMVVDGGNCLQEHKGP
jgi:3-oxoacyl-[acyl-carrier protein] reductase